MNPHLAKIVFVDNAISNIYRTLQHLKSSSLSISFFRTEVEFLENLDYLNPDIVFINLDLIPNDGLFVAKEILNKKLSAEPLIIIYCKAEDDFVVESCLNAGIHGFITYHNKPSMMELYIINLLKRKDPLLIKVDNITLYREKYTIHKGEIEFVLPRKEYQIFELLIMNKDKLFSKTEIAKEIWNDESIAKKRNIDVHIYNIRRVLGEDLITSEKGKGYKFNQLNSLEKIKN